MPVSPALNSQVLASVLAVMDVAPVSAPNVPRVAPVPWRWNGSIADSQPRGRRRLFRPQNFLISRHQRWWRLRDALDHACDLVTRARADIELHLCGLAQIVGILLGLHEGFLENRCLRGRHL